MEEGRAGGRGRSLAYRVYEGIILYIYFISHAKEGERKRERLSFLYAALCFFFE